MLGDAMYEQILFEIEDPVAVITFNRPEKLNPLSDRMRAEIRHAIAAAEASDKVVGIILTGAGRGFSAGADMGELAVIQNAGTIGDTNGPSSLAAHPGNAGLGDDFRQGLSYLFSVRKPIIAAINGPCAGIGFSMAMFCDLRFMSDRSSLVPSFSKLGLVAEHGTAWILPRLLGPSRALEVFWGTNRIEPARALEWGLANRVVAHDDLLAETKRYIEELARTASPFSLMQMKQMVYRHLMLDLGESMTDTNDTMEASVSRPEFREGLAAFAEKRPPVFPRITVD